MRDFALSKRLRWVLVLALLPLLAGLDRFGRTSNPGRSCAFASTRGPKTG